MISGHENITVEGLRNQMALMSCRSGSEEEAIADLIGAVMILCNRIGDLQHRLVDRHFDDGEVLRAALPDPMVGEKIVFHGIMHDVVDAGEQGRRIQAMHIPPGLYQEKGDPRLV